MFKSAAIFSLTALAFSLAPAAHAAPISLGSSYSQNFDTVPNSGSSLTWTNDSTFSGWYTSRTSNGNSFVVSDGSSNGGNLYSFGSTSSSDRALGSIASNNTTVGGAFALGAVFTNDTAGVIDSVVIQFDAEQWRFGNTANTVNAANGLIFSYRIGGTVFDVPTSNSNDATDTAIGWTPASNLNAVAQIDGSGSGGGLDGNAVANRATVSGVISGLNLAPGASLWIRFYDSNNTGQDHGIGIDNFSLVAAPAPEPAGLAILGLGALALVKRRRGC